MEVVFIMDHLNDCVHWYFRPLTTFHSSNFYLHDPLFVETVGLLLHLYDFLLPENLDGVVNFVVVILQHHDSSEGALPQSTKPREVLQGGGVFVLDIIFLVKYSYVFLRRIHGEIGNFHRRMNGKTGNV